MSYLLQQYSGITHHSKIQWFKLNIYYCSRDLKLAQQFFSSVSRGQVYFTCLGISWLQAGLRWSWLGQHGWLTLCLSFSRRLFQACSHSGGRKPNERVEVYKPLKTKTYNWHTMTSSTFYWPEQVTHHPDSNYEKIVHFLMQGVSKSYGKGHGFREEVNWCHFCNQCITALGIKLASVFCLLLWVCLHLSFSWSDFYFLASSLMHLTRFKNIFYPPVLKKIIYHIFSERINQTSSLPYCLIDILMSFRLCIYVMQLSTLILSPNL